MSGTSTEGNKFGLDIFGKKRIAFLEEQLEDLSEKTGFVNNQKKEYEGLPEVKISDHDFVNSLSKEFTITYHTAKKIVDWIEEKIPEEIAGGKKALVWQNLGTFYSVQRNGMWRARVRFHKAFKGILNGGHRAKGKGF